MNLKGRNFLKLLDFTPEEIQYLLDLAADFKQQKKTASVMMILWQKHCADFLKRPLPVPAVPLRLRPMTWE